MAHYLIVDDSAADRRTLSRYLGTIRKGCVVREAADTEGMFREVTDDCSLVLQDISLGGEASRDSMGLAALLDVIDSYPTVPVAVVSGHVKEKVDEILSDLAGVPQFVGVLDKGSYGPEEMERLLGRAERTKAERRRWVESEKRPSADTWEEAFTGGDWVRRLKAEGSLFRGHCPVNAVLVSREVEAAAMLLFKRCGTAPPPRTFGERANLLLAKRLITRRLRQDLGDAWELRNRVVHWGYEPTVDQSMKFIRVLESLRALE